MDIEKIKFFILGFKQQKKKIFILVIIISIIVMFISYTKSRETEGAIIEPLPNVVTNNNQELLEEIDNNICVHISGAVRNSGIVILDGRARIIDAIEAAGGLTEKADISGVNLAYEIADGIKIYIPSINGIKDDSIEYISNNSGENIVEETIINKDSSGKKVNINTAEKSELEKLTGIGPSIAEKIVNYRKTNGKFKTIDDIKNVTGIGNSKFEAIKNQIHVK